MGLLHYVRVIMSGLTTRLLNHMMIYDMIPTNCYYTAFLIIVVTISQAWSLNEYDMIYDMICTRCTELETKNSYEGNDHVKR